MKKRAILAASAIVSKLTRNDGVRSEEHDTTSIGRENARETTPATPERSRFEWPDCMQKRTVQTALEAAILDLQSSGPAQTTPLDDGYHLANERR